MRSTGVAFVGHHGENSAVGFDMGSRCQIDDESDIGLSESIVLRLFRSE